MVNIVNLKVASTPNQIEKICEILSSIGIKYIKTSTTINVFNSCYKYVPFLSVACYLSYALQYG